MPFGLDAGLADPGPVLAIRADREPPGSILTRVSVLAAGPVRLPVRLVRAAHPLHALVTALVLGGAALVSGRPLREGVLVAATVLVGQAVIGWHNDLVDRDRDAPHGRPRQAAGHGEPRPRDCVVRDRVWRCWSSPSRSAAA